VPHINTQVPDLAASGALLQVFIFPPTSQYWTPGMDAQSIPLFVATGMVDTGASISAIDYSVAKKLNLISRDIIPIMTPSGIKNHNTYDVNLMLPKTLEHRSFDIEVVGSELLQQGFQVLIGRDVLKYCSFIFNGVDNSWQLHI
jgi:predicted aspartyl protease